ncbi:beta family protein [Metallibacterium scheffleri]
MTTYLPIIRSRAAELRGLKELPSPTLSKLFPIVELTRSRRTSKNPNGDIQKSVEAICDIMEERPFIVDLTSLASLQNAEFGQVLDDADGFKAWTDFALASLPDQCVPVVHLLEPFELQPFQLEVRRLRKKFSRVAIRVPTSYRDFNELLQACDQAFSNLADVVLTLDAGYVNQNSVDGAVPRLAEMLSAINGRKFCNVSVASSSFPNSVVSAGGEDDVGDFSLNEVLLWNQLHARFPWLDYGDYAAIHPLDFTGTVTNWVPRVDVMLDDTFYYHRYRRSDGGYVRAAKEARRDNRYVPLSSWAQDNIQAAADGAPKGLSPSFWIANRVNFHLARQVARVGR